MRKAIGLDRVRRPARIIEVLNELDADVVALQEADRRIGMRSSALPVEMLETETDYVAVPLNGGSQGIGWHGNAILVKKHHEIVHGEPLFLPMLEPRGAVLADLHIDGEPLRVVGMHLDISGIFRPIQAKSLVDHLNERTVQIPSILMGDLNAWTNNGRAIREFERYHRCASCGPSFHTRRPVATLDRIFVSDHFDITDSGVHTSPVAKRASDHLPVWARLSRIPS